MASTVKSSGFNVRGNTTYGDMNKEDFVDPSKVRGYRGGKKAGNRHAGKLSRQAKVKKEVKPLPPQAVEAEIEGTVILRIEVTKKGQFEKQVDQRSWVWFG